MVIQTLVSKFNTLVCCLGINLRYLLLPPSSQIIYHIWFILLLFAIYSPCLRTPLEKKLLPNVSRFQAGKAISRNSQRWVVNSCCSNAKENFVSESGRNPALMNSPLGAQERLTSRFRGPFILCDGNLRSLYDYVDLLNSGVVPQMRLIVNY